MRLQHVKKAAICSIAAVATSLVVALGLAAWPSRIPPLYKFLFPTARAFVSKT